MIFNKNSNLAGMHAFLSPSNYHWVNYEDEKLDRVFHEKMTARRGTELHAIASELIRMKILLPDNKKTLNRYVNDAIGFRMSSEVTLFYSPNCFGTADAIAFDAEEKILRVHDLKNGVIEASIMQLKVYAAIFCLEYDYAPNKITTELRIYQNDDVVLYKPEPHEIFVIRSKIIQFDKRINELKMLASR